MGKSGMRHFVEKPVKTPVVLKLRINAPGDAQEQHADRIANQVMRKPAGLFSWGHGIEQPQAPSGTELTAPPGLDDAIGGPGEPLSSADRGFMESRFGHDFSQVRVHSGGEASSTARALDAH